MLIRNAAQDIESVMFTREQIAARCRELGQTLTEKFRGEKPLMICVLRGATFFFTDLCREMDCLMDMDFIAASSYFKGTKSSGTVRLVKDSGIDMQDRHVVIVEDIVDSGLTLEYLVKLFQTRSPKSITTVTLLDKNVNKPDRFRVDYYGFKIPDAFVVGYGLDYADYYRNLPYIGVIKEECYK
ncbi:MAG: hypoxanthine phosphoribosyltransferase [Oscillospiraceae bacterium]|nr:hypoxanthine phosphoribosyltransferase [Oscillospiraceae bacterium]